MPLNTMIAFGTLILLASCSPGPNVLATISSALRHGLRGTALSIGGNLAALFIVAAAAAFGVGSLVTLFPMLLRC